MASLGRSYQLAAGLARAANDVVRCVSGGPQRTQRPNPNPRFGAQPLPAKQSLVGALAPLFPGLLAIPQHYSSAPGAGVGPAVCSTANATGAAALMEPALELLLALLEHVGAQLPADFVQQALGVLVAAFDTCGVV